MKRCLVKEREREERGRGGGVEKSSKPRGDAVYVFIELRVRLALETRAEINPAQQNGSRIIVHGGVFSVSDRAKVRGRRT